MTVKQLFTVYDRVAKECAPVFEANNNATAMRMYNLMVAKEGVQPGDYSLYWIGFIDKETMEVVGGKPYEVIAALDEDDVEEEEYAEGV